MRTFAVTALLLLTLAGCSGLSKRVDRDLLRQVPNEELLLLFDAENGVFIARDEGELAQKNLIEARAGVQRAERYRTVIDARKKSGSAVDTPEVLDLLQQWNEARIRMREREVDLLEEELRSADVRLWTARARYEAAKAKLVKDKNPEAGASINVAEFDAQVVSWQAKEAQALAKLEAKTQTLLAERESYNALSTRLQGESRGAYGGPWADLLN